MTLGNVTARILHAATGHAVGWDVTGTHSFALVDRGCLAKASSLVPGSFVTPSPERPAGSSFSGRI